MGSPFNYYQKIGSKPQDKASLPESSAHAPRLGGRIFIYVQHLLGTGHLKRAASLARALVRQGAHVELISGGMPVVHLSFPVFQLPPTRCDAGNLSTLFDEHGQPVSDAWRSRRRSKLIERFLAFDPDVLITETFPFGRRQMHFELLPLLDAAREAKRRPVIISSVRDVLQKRRRKRIAETVSLIQQYFDRILVHGDPALIEFGESFDLVDEINDKLVYTGYISEPYDMNRSAYSEGKEEILVSGGGGAVSKRLFMTALKAQPLSKLKTLPWRLLVGHDLSEQDHIEIKSRAGHGVIVERARDDFPSLLAKCAVSVSQCGYNTAVSLLQVGVRSVIVPYSGDGETEQALRAQRLHDRGYAIVLSETECTPRTLTNAIERAAKMTLPTGTIDFRGAENSAQIIVQEFHTRMSLRP